MSRIHKVIRRLVTASSAALALSSMAHAEPPTVLKLYGTGIALNGARVMQLKFAESTRKGWEYGPEFTQTGGTDARVVGLLQGGAAADIIIVQTSEMAKLQQAGLVRPGTVKPLGQADIAVGVKAGSPHPDISTYPKFRDALLKAGSVAYTDPKSGSAGGLLIDSIMSRPDLAGVKRVHNARVTSGDVPIWLEAAGQLRGAYGVDEIGLLPASLNAHLQFSIAVGKNAQHPQEAIAFENYVLRPQFAPVWTKWGIAR